MIETIIVNDIKFSGVKLDLGNANLLLIRAEKGFLACGYIGIETCNKLGDVAAIVKGVKNFDDMLNENVADLSEKAKEIMHFRA